MDLATKIAEDINRLITSNRALLEEANVDSINVKAFEARENLINQFTNLLTQLPDVIAAVESAVDKAKQTHAKELSAVDSLLHKLKKRENRPEDVKSWTTIVRKKPAETAVIKPTALTPSKYTKIKFTEALSIPAIKVPTFDYVKQDGELYYIECANHFAFKLNGHLLHGNIGIIYTEEKNPGKIKDCKFAASCMKQEKCDYYHDPLKFGGSTDFRNFIASSWLYAPPNSHYKNRPRSRRFGSRDYLDVDLVGLLPEEISRFNDQTMHDLLCSILLNQAHAEG